MSSYSQEISRQTPAYFIFLLDQSGSMLEPIGGGDSKPNVHGTSGVVEATLDVSSCKRGSVEAPLGSQLALSPSQRISDEAGPEDMWEYNLL